MATVAKNPAISETETRQRTKKEENFFVLVVVAVYDNGHINPYAYDMTYAIFHAHAPRLFRIMYKYR